MSEGFLGRWSRRKLDARPGGSVEERPVSDAPQPPGTADAHRAAQRVGTSQAVEDSGAAGLAGTPAGAAAGDDRRGQLPAPSLQDVEALTAESDYTRFAAADVAPEVKNAAMKKLFADPRYNVMDGLDVYTGDYTQPDPIPEAMLRQLTSAAVLGLFDEEQQPEAAGRARDVADNPTAQSVAQSGATTPAVPARHADPDLQLQQDDAPPGEDPGRGAG